MTVKRRRKSKRMLIQTREKEEVWIWAMMVS